MNCKHYRIRTKKKVHYKYCVLLKKIIKDDCYNCINKEYKEVKPLKKVRIKSISKKREFVSKRTYDIVFERCNGKCAICGSYTELHLHHINGRGKGKTDNPNNCIILCRQCHIDKVHNNNKYWRKKLKEMIDND